MGVSNYLGGFFDLWFNWFGEVLSQLNRPLINFNGSSYSLSILSIIVAGFVISLFVNFAVRGGKG